MMVPPTGILTRSMCCVLLLSWSTWSCCLQVDEGSSRCQAMYKIPDEQEEVLRAGAILEVRLQLGGATLGNGA